MLSLKEYMVADKPMQKAVIGFCIDNEQVLLVRRKKSSIGLGVGVLAGVGGKVGDTPEIKDESIEEALVREFYEETGLKPIEYKHVGTAFFLNPEKEKFNMDCEIFIITAWKGVLHEISKDGAAIPEWHYISKLPVDEMFPDNKLWVPKVLAGDEFDIAILLNPKIETIEYKIFDKGSLSL